MGSIITSHKLNEYLQLERLKKLKTCFPKERTSRCVVCSCWGLDHVGFLLHGLVSHLTNSDISQYSYVLFLDERTKIMFPELESVLRSKNIEVVSIGIKDLWRGCDGHRFYGVLEYCRDNFDSFVLLDADTFSTKAFSFKSIFDKLCSGNILVCDIFGNDKISDTILNVRTYGAENQYAVLKQVLRLDFIGCKYSCTSDLRRALVELDGKRFWPSNMIVCMSKHWVTDDLLRGVGQLMSIDHFVDDESFFVLFYYLGKGIDPFLRIDCGRIVNVDNYVYNAGVYNFNAMHELNINYLKSIGISNE